LAPIFGTEIDVTCEFLREGRPPSAGTSSKRNSFLSPPDWLALFAAMAIGKRLRKFGSEQENLH